MQTCLGTAIEIGVQSTNTTHWLHGPFGISSKWISYIAYTDMLEMLLQGDVQACTEYYCSITCRPLSIYFGGLRVRQLASNTAQSCPGAGEIRWTLAGNHTPTAARGSETRNRGAEMLQYAR